MAVVLPLVLLLIDYFQHRKFDKNSLIEKIPYFIIALIFGIIALFARQVGSEMQIIAKFSAFERIMFASYGFLFYIFKMLVPVNLSALYPYPDKLIQSLPAIFYIAPVLAGLVGALVFIFRKVDRSIPFGFLFYLVLIFPVLQIIQTGEAITADRYFYLASVGLFFIIGFAVEKISNKYKKMPYITNMLISIIVLPVILITWNRTKVWKDEVTLMDDVILKNKNVSTAYFNLGVNYYKDKKINTALIMLNQTLRLNPDYEKAFYYIGACNNANGEFTDAVKMLKKAIQKNPANINAYAELGSVYMKLKEWENAEKYLSTALEIDKNNVEVNFNLATASMNLKKYDRAIELFKNVIGQNKSHYSAITKLGLSFYYKGEYDTALKYLETAIALQPGSNSAYAAKGLVYSDGIKDKLKAVEAYKTAAKLGDKGSQIWLLNNGENLSF
jgi:tetratricopeptide (TPR) repeat protein